MTTFQHVTVEPLSPEAFAPYGEVLTLPEGEPHFTGIGSAGWRTSFACDGPAEVMVYSSRYTGFAFTMLERHHGVTQTFIPLGRVPAIVAVAAPTDGDAIPNPGDVRGFLLDGSMGYILKRGTWHSLDRFPLAPPSSEILIITSRATQEELESSPRDTWQLTQQVDYQTTFGIAFRFISA